MLRSNRIRVGTLADWLTNIKFIAINLEAVKGRKEKELEIFKRMLVLMHFYYEGELDDCSQPSIFSYNFLRLHLLLINFLISPQPYFSSTNHNRHTKTNNQFCIHIICEKRKTQKKNSSACYNIVLEFVQSCA